MMATLASVGRNSDVLSLLRHAHKEGTHADYILYKVCLQALRNDRLVLSQFHELLLGICQDHELRIISEGNTTRMSDASTANDKAGWQRDVLKRQEQLIYNKYEQLLYKVEGALSRWGVVPKNSIGDRDVARANRWPMHTVTAVRVDRIGALLRNSVSALRSQGQRQGSSTNNPVAPNTKSDRSFRDSVPNGAASAASVTSVSPAPLVGRTRRDQRNGIPKERADADCAVLGVPGDTLPDAQRREGGENDSRENRDVPLKFQNLRRRSLRGPPLSTSPLATSYLSSPAPASTAFLLPDDPADLEAPPPLHLQGLRRRVPRHLRQGEWADSEEDAQGT